MKSIFKNKILFLIIISIFWLQACKIKEKPKAYEKSYSVDAPVIDKDTGVEDTSDILKYVSSINYSEMKIPTEEELLNNPELENDLWQELVNHTVYKRMPVGYKDNFNLRKCISVKYTYNMYINGLKGISYDDECKFVKEFLIKRIFEKIGVK